MNVFCIKVQQNRLQFIKIGIKVQEITIKNMLKFNMINDKGKSVKIIII